MKKFFTKKVCIIALIVLAIGALAFFLARKKKTADAPVEVAMDDDSPVTSISGGQPQAEEEPSKPSETNSSQGVRPKKPYVTDQKILNGKRPGTGKIVNTLSISTKPAATNDKRLISEADTTGVRRKIKVGRK